MAVTFSVLTNADLIEARNLGMAMDGWTDARLHFLPALGYVARAEDGRLVGIGCVAWVGKGKSGKAVGILSLSEDFRQSSAARWLFRRAAEVIDLALLTSPKVFATPDESIKAAIPFLERLGFVCIGREWVRHASDPDDRFSRDSRRIVRDDAVSVADGNGGCASTS